MVWLIVIIVGYVISNFIARKMVLNALSYIAPIDEENKNFAKKWALFGPLAIFTILTLRGKKCFKEKKWE